MDYNYIRLLVIITENLKDYLPMYNLDDFSFSNEVSELQMKLPSFLGYFNTCFYSVCNLFNCFL